MESSAGLHHTPSSAPRPTGLQRVAAWLEPLEIVLDAELRDRRHALEFAATETATRQRLDAAPVLRALWRRELAGSTAIGCGVAIPHARLAGVDRPAILFIRPRFAIDFAAPDGKPVSSILVILVPSDGCADDHLELLALVGGMFSDREFRSRLAEAITVEESRTAVHDWVARNV